MGFFGFEGSQPHRYTTLQRIRDEGFAITSLPDADALRAVETASRLVNQVTDQLFVPIFQVLELDGEGDPVIHHPKLLPILKVLRLAFINIDLLGTTPLTTDEFSIHNTRRFIKREPLIGFTGRKKFVFDPDVGAKNFPRGVRNVELRAYFGWLEAFKEIETKTTTDVANGAVSVDVESVDGILQDDVIVARDSDDNSFFAIVTAIDVANKKLFFDVINGLSKTVASGAELFAFGRVPLLVERATLILLNDLTPKIGSSSFLRNQFLAGVISERTDNYNYRKQSSSGGDLGSRINSTGSLEADNLLSNFTAPPLIAFA